MTELDRHFHRAQAKTQLRSGSVKRHTERASLFQPEFVGIETKTNRQRWIAYQVKLAAQEIAA